MSKKKNKQWLTQEEAEKLKEHKIAVHNGIMKQRLLELLLISNTAPTPEEVAYYGHHKFPKLIPNKK